MRILRLTFPGLLFNVNGGYLEGIVRGYRNTLLTSTNYGNVRLDDKHISDHMTDATQLTQCETIDDVKTQLGPAYGDSLANLPPNPSTSALANKTTEKLVADFRYLQGQATGSLSKFMEYLTYSYMIDNVALLITGTLHERDTKELLERCHPLGWFETMPVLCVATNIEELYNSVLIETPLAPYFKGSLSHQDLDELNIEIVRNTLYKNYLEDFHNFVNTDPEMAMTPTGEVMSEILQFEADRRAINITINSFGTELTKEQRRKLYPEFGKLYPEGMLMLSRADDLEGVGLAVSGIADYKRFFDEVGFNQSSGVGGGNMAGGMGGESKSLEDMFYQKEMELSKMVFTRQFTHAVIYAWVKLREQVSPNLLDRHEVIAANSLAGNQEHHVDCGMHRPEPEREDRELHQCLLTWLPRCTLHARRFGRQD
jgi:V-type H+-transporting ATPase subunit d